jgi:hypothetical protein
VSGPRGPLLLAALLCACGSGGRDAAIAGNATNAANLQAQVEVLCAPDAGTCDPRVVRALERGAFCAESSTLVLLGKPAPDAGIACQK